MIGLPSLVWIGILVLTALANVLCALVFLMAGQQRRATCGLVYTVTFFLILAYVEALNSAKLLEGLYFLVSMIALLIIYPNHLMMEASQKLRFEDRESHQKDAKTKE